MPRRPPAVQRDPVRECCNEPGTECQARLLQAPCKSLTLCFGAAVAALCLVLLTRGPSGEPAMVTDVVWRSVSRPLVMLRNQRQPPQTAQQWGDPLDFGSRPRPLDQVPHWLLWPLGHNLAPPAAPISLKAMTAL